MHFHLPKPLHGWREFVGEVGIIVLGVLIALGAEQLVEEWRWHEQAQVTRQSLSDEIAESAGDAKEREAVEECLRGRIAELVTKLNSAAGSWRASPQALGPAADASDKGIPVAYRAPNRAWKADQWEAAKAAGMLDHLNRDEVTSYGEIYSIIAGIRGLQQQEVGMAARLSFLSFDQRLDNRSRIEALATLGELDRINAGMASLGAQLVDDIRQMHLPLDHRRIAKDLHDVLLAQRRFRGACVKDVNVDY